MESRYRLKVFSLTGIERGEERAILHERTQRAALFGVVVPVSLGALRKLAGKLFVSFLCGKPCQSIVGHIVFKCV